jgi:hypothetical protein
MADAVLDEEKAWQSQYLLSLADQLALTGERERILERSIQMSPWS